MSISKPQLVGVSALVALLAGVGVAHFSAERTLSPAAFTAVTW